MPTLEPPPSPSESAPSRSILGLVTNRLLMLLLLLLLLCRLLPKTGGQPARHRLCGMFTSALFHPCRAFSATKPGFAMLVIALMVVPLLCRVLAFTRLPSLCPEPRRSGRGGSLSLLVVVGWWRERALTRVAHASPRKSSFIHRARLSSLLFSTTYSSSLFPLSLSFTFLRFSFLRVPAHGTLAFSSFPRHSSLSKGMHVVRSCCPSSFKGVQPPLPRATFRGESDHRETISFSRGLVRSLLPSFLAS